MKPLFALVLFILLLLPVAAGATNQMALDSGHSCSYCHLDPAGGGTLTEAGEAYFERLYAEAPTPAGWAEKLPMLLVGYLHILFAVLWFGTILYVHLVLKPAYAASGLPRGEKLVGVISFWVVGITGVVLTLDRLDAWSQLFETRFGVLLSLKVGLYLLMLASAILVIKVIGPRLTQKDPVEHVAGEPFTAQTLESFDGKEGRPCYFAYAGKVYDASDSRMWQDGLHMKRHVAGSDLSEALALAPHQDEVMERLPVVGEYDAEAQPRPALRTRLFFGVAYMNLGIVLVILFILALWRWG